MRTIFQGFVGAFAFLAVLELVRFGWRRRQFGRVLWSTPRRFWPICFAGVFSVLTLPDLFDSGADGRDDTLKGSLYLFIFSQVILRELFARKLRVYEGGVSVDALTLTWSELQGWAFGPEGKWSGKPPEVQLAVTDTGSSRLYLWSDSLWPLLHGRNPRRPVKACVECTPDLGAILREHAPELNIATSETNPGDVSLA